MRETKAYAAKQPKEPLEPFHITRRDPGKNDVVIDIAYCGICHSDIHQVREEWDKGTFPMVPGHEIVGKIVEVGRGVKRVKVGDHVGVGCFVDSCRKCPECKKGLQQFCEKTVFTYNSKEKDGSPTYGGYSKQIVVDQNYLLKIPKNLPLDAAAPLLCAGITMYSPLKHWKIKKGSKVAIMGLGGLGHMGVKLAKALGAEVTVLSTSDRKKADATKFGAKHFVNTKNPEEIEKFKNYFDLILNTISADIDLEMYTNLLKRDGTIVLLGAPDRPYTLKVLPLISRRRSLTGSLIGGLKETQEMLNFCGKKKITSDIEVIRANEINNAYERMLKGDVRYRFVIDAESL